MTAFVVAAFLSPMVVGLGVPYFLALGGDRRWIRAGLFLVATALLVLLLATLSGRRLAHAMALWVYMGSVALLMAGLFEALRAIRLPAAAGQLLCGLTLTGMVASLFCSDPFIQAADRPQDLVYGFLRLSPMPPVGSAIEAGDVLRLEVMYGLSRLADYGRNDVHWAEASVRLALIGGGLLALSFVPRLIGGSHGSGSQPVQPPAPVPSDRGEGAAAAS